MDDPTPESTTARETTQERCRLERMAELGERESWSGDTWRAHPRWLTSYWPSGAPKRRSDTSA
ncbi:MAG: hypothetical protein KJ048_16545 [Dehalococcoidia bacterium]|nr:hypothetical protein [Dehalococcoidia bacterium]